MNFGRVSEILDAVMVEQSIRWLSLATAVQGLFRVKRVCFWICRVANWFALNGMLIKQRFGEVVLVFRNSDANDRNLLVTTFEDPMSPKGGSQIMIVLCWFLVDSESWAQAEPILVVFSQSLLCCALIVTHS